jgi:hypothetical protein
MYGKIFDSMYDGTLAEDWRALITFQQMIVLCDADGTVDMTHSSIARRTGIPIEHITAGIEILEAVDPHSRTEDDEGRRIARLDEHRAWGWNIVNHQKYKYMQDADEVRKQNRERKQRYREAKKNAELSQMSHVVPPCPAPSRYTDTDTDIKQGNFVPPSLQEVTEYLTKKGSSVDPIEFHAHYSANGWMRGKNKIKNWKMCLTTWEQKRKKTARSTPSKPASEAGLR